MTITDIILLVAGTMLMMNGIIILSLCKKINEQNKVHFYLVQTSFMTFDLFLGYPKKVVSPSGVWWIGNRVYVDNLKDYGINLSDYNNLKYDKPVEVFLNLED